MKCLKKWTTVLPLESWIMNDLVASMGWKVPLEKSVPVEGGVGWGRVPGCSGVGGWEGESVAVAGLDGDWVSVSDRVLGGVVASAWKGASLPHGKVRSFFLNVFSFPNW